MKVTCHDISRLATVGETDFEYDLLAEHLDTCVDCQQQLDSQCSSADVTDMVQQVSAAGEEAFPGLLFHPGTDEQSRLEPPRHPELLGRLGRYDIERTVGRGGMGVVYKAMDTELHRVVAVKVLAGHLATSAAARRRFAREAQAAAAVLHPNVIPIYNVEAAGETPYLVMQFIAGESLQSRVEEHGPLSIVDVLRIGKQAAEGLSAAHDQGLVHRDVKPANILLEDKTDRVVLSDFGLARTSDDASLTQTGIVAGTPHYMSPEQATGQPVTAASDLFALGSVLYFALSGRPPFRAESAMGVLNCICTRPHRPIAQVNESVPRELAQLVDRLLSKKASRRFSSAEHVADGLENILSRVQQGKIRLVSPPNWKHRFCGGAVVCACVALAGWASWQWLQPKPSRIGDVGLASQSGMIQPDVSEQAAAETEPGPSHDAGRASVPRPTDVQWLTDELLAGDSLRAQTQDLLQEIGRLQEPVEVSRTAYDLTWQTEIRAIGDEMERLELLLNDYGNLDDEDSDTHPIKQ